LNLHNTIWIYILPFLINPFYVFMMRTFFQQIPDEIRESAIIDGASEYRYFFSILIPLAKPVVAAVSLFTFLARWNEWFTSMIYIDNRDLDSLQYLLRRILDNARILQEAAVRMRGIQVTQGRIPTETIQMAMAIITAGPALLVFPFFQRYFVKGLTVGSIKG
jgi:putative aldouronate transport system permease protein